MWITIEAERVLYVDRGRDVILCDRGHSGPVTLVVKIMDSDNGHAMVRDNRGRYERNICRRLLAYVAPR